jgi:hypothetical protein
MSSRERASKTHEEAIPKCPGCLSSFLVRKRRHAHCPVCGWDSRRAVRCAVDDRDDVLVAVTCWPRSLVPEALA